MPHKSFPVTAKFDAKATGKLIPNVKTHCIYPQEKSLKIEHCL